MQRSKFMAALAALLASGVAAFLLMGGASASSWHVYEGDLYPGHAYGVQVPAGAQTLEFAVAGEGAAASLGVFAPDGKRLGLYDLDAQTASASIANPAAGRYVAYVYDLSGALTVRVDASEAPPLGLQTIPLAREDVKIGTFERQALDKIVTTDLKAAPVLVTLLYEGSARNLAATVSSAKGAVATITGETGTAFSPGVWTSLKGERAFDAANLDGTVYTVAAKADSFEGTMVLSTLALDLGATFRPAPIAPTDNVSFPREVPGWQAASPQGFALREGWAVAFQAVPGKLLLADPILLDGNETRDDGGFRHGLVTLYGPDDAVVGVVQLDDDQPSAEIDLPVAGEYVAYVLRAEEDGILAKLPGQALPALRHLALAEESFELPTTSLLAGDEQEIELAHVPVMMASELRDGVGVLPMLRVSNENGVVLARNDLLAAGYAFPAGDTVCPKNFQAGAHTVRLDGVYEGALVITSTYFVRGVEAPAETPHAEHEADHGHESGAPPLDLSSLLAGLGQ